MDNNDRSELVGLAARLDELTAVCTRLSRENAELRDEVARLNVGARSPAWPSLGASTARQRSAGSSRALAWDKRRGRPGARDGLDGVISRRMIGKALGAVAVGTVGAAALVNEGSGSAEAADGDAIKAGQSTTCESATELKFDGTVAPGMIFLVNDTTFGGGASAHPAALGGWAGGDVANGVYGFTEVEASDGVIGQVGTGNTTGNGVHGLAANPATVAVFGENTDGTAIAGNSDTVAADATAILGTITSTNPGNLSAAVRGVNNGTGVDGIGVWGSQAGAGWGVYGSVPHGIGVNADAGTGIGVQGHGNTGGKVVGKNVGLVASGPTAVQANSSGTSGVGVQAHGSGTGGRGGMFSGSAAQVQLSPGSNATHPRSGKRGDLYADKSGRLWFCKTGGTIATWHQIA